MGIRSSRDASRNITKILNEFFSSGYDKRVRPNYGECMISFKLNDSLRFIVVEMESFSILALKCTTVLTSWLTLVLS